MENEIVREAKLFEAAVYPDRGVSFTEADLDAIVSGFKSEAGIVAVKVSHMSTPFDGRLGYLKEVWRVGKDLMGRICFPKAVWDFLEAMGTKKISVGFDWRQRRLREVSIVSDPRVLTARIFGGIIGQDDAGLLVFESGFDTNDEGGIIPMAEGMTSEFAAVLKAEREAGRIEGLSTGRAESEAQFSERIGPLAKENAELKRKNALEAAQVKITGYKLEGKLTPAAEKFADAILVDGLVEVTFSDGGHMSVADAFVQFMTYQGPIVQTVGGVPADKDAAGSEVEEFIYDSLGVTAAEVEAAEAAVPSIT